MVFEIVLNTYTRDSIFKLENEICLVSIIVISLHCRFYFCVFRSLHYSSHIDGSNSQCKYIPVFFKQASGCQVTQPPPGPPSLRDDGQLPELRQGEGALQGQVRPAQQPAGLPRRETGLDTGRYGGQRATF